MPVRSILFASLVSLSLLSCGDRSASSASNIPVQPDQVTQITEGQLPPGFLDFYEKFHADSLYQMAHIAWPLQGVTSVPVDSGTYVKKSIFWEPQNWRMHRPVDFSSGDFKRRWELMGDELIVERIAYAAANFGLERRFIKSDSGDWELIYYSDMQEMEE